MTDYQCPLCGREIKRDLALYLDHTQHHVMDQIKKEHPEWVEADGVCRPCGEYYRKQLSFELSSANIGPHGKQSRMVIGITAFVFSLSLALLFFFAGIGKPWRILLFLPLFIALLGFIQAREKTCALLAEFGLVNMDSGDRKIDDAALRNRFKVRGRIILLKSALWAALLTALFFFLP